MTWKRTRRALGWLAAAVLALEIVYVLAANTVIYSGVIQHSASVPPENVNLAWDHAYSPWPGRVYVSGFRMRVQDPVQQFRLTIDKAQVDIVLQDLLHKKFRATRVRAEGVSFRLLLKVDTTAGREERVAAFPPLEGFTRPALRPDPMPPFPTPAQLKNLWTVQLDDVDTTVNELWFLEYRYLGPAHVNGGFALTPLQKLWVGPARLDLNGGALSAGDHVISPALAGRLDVTITPVDLLTSPGLRVLHTLTAAVRFDTTVEDLGVADLYREGLRVTGAGRVGIDLHIADSRLVPGSSIDVSLPAADVRLHGGDRFRGEVHAKLSVPPETKAPTVHGSLGGELTLPITGIGNVAAVLSNVTAEVVFADNDVARPVVLQRLYTVLGEARVTDARALTRRVGSVVPVIAGVVLGDGPLVASASAYITPEYSLVRLKRLELGSAEIEGAAMPGASGWSGAVAGHFGAIPVGLRLQKGKIESSLFIPASWLGSELAKAGIEAG